MRVRKITNEYFHQLMTNLYRELAIGEYRPRAIVGIVGNGLVPATYLSRYYNVPLYTFDCHSTIAPDDPTKLGDILSSSRSTLVVGIQTDKGLHDLFEKANEVDGLLTSLHMRSATLFHDVLFGDFTPDFYAEEVNVHEREKIILPWEFQ